MANIGMIGLGLIGMPLARNLMLAGHTVFGYRRSGMADFVAAGGIAAGSARAVIETCETVFSCLPDEQSLSDVVSGASGLAAGDCGGRLLIELSTLSTECKLREAGALRARGGDMLDCAISGIPVMVQNRTGIIYVSGEERLYTASKALFDAISSRVFFIGPFGDALKVKLCANTLVALNIAATAETLALATKMGLDLGRMIEAIKDGAGGSLQFTARARTMALGEWDTVRATTATLVKDVHLIRKQGEQLDCPLPLMAVAERMYDTAMRSGLAEKDVAAVYAVVAQAAKIPVPAGKSGP